MSKLYFRVYLHFLAIIAAFAIVVAVGWLAHTHDNQRRDRFEAMGRLVAQSLPANDAEMPAALERLDGAAHVRHPEKARRAAELLAAHADVAAMAEAVGAA